jgi:DNA-binding MarR family transcriptional regulator
MPSRYTLDAYIVDVLMPDLVGHDRHPAAFLVYLYLWCRRAGRMRKSATVSLRQIALEVGLSKSAVQKAIRKLKRRKLVTSHQSSVTAVPEYILATPWVRP